MGRFEEKLRGFKGLGIRAPAGAISESFVRGFPGGCFIGLGYLSWADFDGRTGDNLEPAVRRLYGDLCDRVTEGVGSLATVRRCRRDRHFMRLGALISEVARGQVELLMREHHRLRVAIGGPVLDPVTTQAARAHAATLA
jgi:hypothetical protein